MNLLLEYTLEQLEEQRVRYARRLSIAPNDVKTAARQQYLMQVMAVRTVERELREDLEKVFHGKQVA